MDCATWKYANLLFVSLGVSRACIQGSQTALPAEDILHCLFIGIERRRKILLLLFYVIQRLIDLILLPLHSRNMAEQSSQLRNKLAPRSHLNERLRFTLFPFSIRARSQTAISPANRLKSRTCVSSSLDQRLTISSIVLPLSMDGGGTAIEVFVLLDAAALAPGAEIDGAM